MMLIIIRDVEVVPYVRMTKRGKWVDERAKRYLVNKEVIQYCIKGQMKKYGYEKLPGQTPLYVDLFLKVLSHQGHKCDIDNLAKAVLDACNNLVYPDDRWEEYNSRNEAKKEGILRALQILEFNTK